MRSLDAFSCAGFIVVSFVLAGVAQTLWLKSSFSTRFAFPLDGGLTFRGKRLFGDNKTLRGFVVMVPAAAAAFAGLGALCGLAPNHAGVWPLGASDLALLGCVAALGFMLGELPNSFVKRQLGVAPGAAPENAWGRIASFLVDRLDSLVGMLVAIWLVVPLPGVTWLLLFGVGPLIHWSFSVALYRLGGKARPA